MAGQGCGWESNNEKYRANNSSCNLAARESGPKSDWSSNEYLCSKIWGIAIFFP
jgi:hypothetical protein